MTTSIKGSDPRVKRTRQLIKKSFIELLEEKGFSSISVQEVAERATVNRATFYAHFEDKYALLDCCIREGFQQVLAEKLPASITLNRSSLRLLILSAFDFFSEMMNNDHCRPLDRQFDPQFESIVQQELCNVFLAGMRSTPLIGLRRSVTAETVATVTSWAICGAAVQWSRGDRKPPAEEMATQVLTVIIGGLAQALPTSFLE